MKFRKLMTALTAVTLMLGMGSVQAADLRVGVEGAYPPFSWKESDGTLKGFDIEIAEAICAEMQRKCVLIEQDWDGMIPALLAKKFDTIIASMSITEERKKRVDFSDKYYNTPAKFVAKKGAGLKITKEGLKGKRIGLQRGTTHQCFMEKMFPDVELVLYGTQDEVFQDLAIGRIDAQFSDSIAADDGFLKTDAGKDFEFTGGDQHDEACHGPGAGMTVRKQDKELRMELNAAIKALREKGIYQKINAKYFDFDIFGG
ncbi:MAG: ABC transporter substrate-binding protein [Gammaproteobacteria bacterium]|nr:ABC transporter substrate-binding protein [Gammaproteobacteria bacterium]MDH3858353.1 ABC transporter substrate-binding protein [Gammaproteobacteria bacterium]